MSDVLIEKSRFNALIEANKELAQAYHIMCNICQPLRHSSYRYEECDEQSCKLAKETLERILRG